MKELAQVAYEAYVDSCGGVSVRGDTLPAWDEQAPEIRQHWDAAVQAVVAELMLGT